MREEKECLSSSVPSAAYAGERDSSESLKAIFRHMNSRGPASMTLESQLEVSIARASNPYLANGIMIDEVTVEYFSDVGQSGGGRPRTPDAIGCSVSRFVARRACALFFGAVSLPAAV